MKLVSCVRRAIRWTAASTAIWAFCVHLEKKSHILLRIFATWCIFFCYLNCTEFSWFLPSALFCSYFSFSCRYFSSIFISELLFFSYSTTFFLVVIVVVVHFKPAHCWRKCFFMPPPPSLLLLLLLFAVLFCFLALAAKNWNETKWKVSI